jgi:N-acetylmuramoyl-L-alanine amidase
VFSLSDKKVVVIDAGHYSNRYNVGISGLYYESEGMLKLSKLIQAKLNTTGKVDCYLTREDEKDISLYQRGKIASDKGAFIFISEHSNASGSPSVTGAEGLTKIFRICSKTMICFLIISWWYIHKILHYNSLLHYILPLRFI